MRILCSILMFMSHAAMTRSATTDNDSKDGVSSKQIPYPFAPPSKEFCDSNTLGDDAYVSAFMPCNFVFYDTNEMPEHFSCTAYGESTTVVKTEQRKVVMWPDSCVAAGPRCYSIDDTPTLYNYTLFNETEFAMIFPETATVVSVDCTADFAKVNEFIENLPEEMADVASSVSFASGVFLLAVVASIVACICCCFGACRGRERRPQGTYVAVPGHPVKAEPVHSAVVYGTQPATKGMV